MLSMEIDDARSAVACDHRFTTTVIKTGVYQNTIPHYDYILPCDLNIMVPNTNQLLWYVTEYHYNDVKVYCSFTS